MRAGWHLHVWRAAQRPGDVACVHRLHARVIAPTCSTQSMAVAAALLQPGLRADAKDVTTRRSFPTRQQAPPSVARLQKGQCQFRDNSSTRAGPQCAAISILWISALRLSLACWRARMRRLPFKNFSLATCCLHSLACIPLTKEQQAATQPEWFRTHIAAQAKSHHAHTEFAEQAA